MERPELPKLDGAGRSPAAARIGARRLVVGGAEADAAILAREAIPLDARIAGPAIIEEAGATTLLPPSWSARLEPSGSLVLERQ
jgi:N-methylhydantoinase A/oxoprolinase/acetone carboxylase beta subunit